MTTCLDDRSFPDYAHLMAKWHAGTRTDQRFITWYARNYWSKTSPNGHGCLEWQGRLSAQGYGRSRAGDQTYAHRIAWLGSGRDIPAGMELDHICRNPACIRVDHLRAVSHRVNLLNSDVPRRRVGGLCKYGHRIGSDQTGAPVCKVCRYEGIKRWRAAHKEQSRSIDAAAKRQQRARKKDRSMQSLVETLSIL